MNSEFIDKNVNKPALKSKKWVATMIGVGAVLFVFITSLITIITTPAAAQPVVTLANIVVVFLGMLVSILLTGQSAVDWRNSSVLQSAYTQENKDINEDIKHEDVEYTPRPRDLDDGIIE